MINTNAKPKCIFSYLSREINRSVPWTSKRANFFPDMFLSRKPSRNAHWHYNFLGARSVVECRTPEREVGGSKPTAAVLCPWARHFTPRKYWLITQEAVAPSRYDWKIVDWDVKPQHNQPNPWCSLKELHDPSTREWCEMHRIARKNVTCRLHLVPLPLNNNMTKFV